MNLGFGLINESKLLNSFKWILVGLYAFVSLISLGFFIYSMIKKRYNKMTLMYLMIFIALLCRTILSSIPMHVYDKIQKHVYLQMVRKNLNNHKEIDPFNVENKEMKFVYFFISKNLKNESKWIDFKALML